MSKDILLELLDLLKQNNQNYFLTILEQQKDNETKIEIFSSLDEDEMKGLIKAVKDELKNTDNKNE